MNVADRLDQWGATLNRWALALWISVLRGAHRVTDPLLRRIGG